MRTLLAAVLAFTLLGQGAALAQARPAQPTPAQPTPTQPAPAQPTTSQPVPSQVKIPKPPVPSAPQTAPLPGVPTEPGFTIGPEDVLGILVWREPDVSGDVAVRPDGMITLPLIRDIKAAGLTPDELADRIQTAMREFINDASVAVTVRQMNSRKVFITGEVSRPGAYPLAAPMTVMQLIAVAGGLNEFADSKRISVMRVEAGRTRTFPFAYKDVASGKRPGQNIMLKPGDTVVVPER
jgi:polysaccharide export outer membrane protein